MKIMEILKRVEVIFFILFIALFCFLAISSNLYLVSIFGILITIAIFGGIYLFNRLNEHKKNMIQKVVSKFAILLIILVTLIPRVITVFSIDINAYIVHDFGTYQKIAEALSEDSELPNTSAKLFPHMLSYPYVLSVIYMIFGNNILVGQLFNIILDIISAILIYAICKKISKNSMLSLLISLLYTLTIGNILYSILLTNEHLSIMMLLLLVYIVFLKGNKEHSSLSNILFSILIGIVISIINSIRPIGILIVISYLIMLIVKGTKPSIIKTSILSIVIVLFSYFIGNNLITMFNEKILNDKIIKSTYSFTLYTGANSNSNGEWNTEDAKHFNYLYTQKYSNDGYLASKELNNETINRYINMGLSSTSELIINRYIKMWGKDESSIDYLRQYASDKSSGFVENNQSKLKDISNMQNVVLILSLLIISIVYILKIIKGKQEIDKYMIFILSIVILQFLLYTISETAGRYTYMARPLLFVLIAMMVSIKENNVLKIDNLLK